MDILIRPASENDYETICRLNHEALGADYDAESTLLRLKYLIKQTDHKIFVADCGEIAVGYVHAANYDCTYSGPVKDIKSIAVDFQFHGIGIGRALLSTVEQWAKETGAVGIRLTSNVKRENAHKFYLACGYTNPHNSKKFYKFF